MSGRENLFASELALNVGIDGHGYGVGLRGMRRTIWNTRRT